MYYCNFFTQELSLLSWLKFWIKWNTMLGSFDTGIVESRFYCAVSISSHLAVHTPDCPSCMEVWTTQEFSATGCSCSLITSRLVPLMTKTIFSSWSLCISMPELCQWQQWLLTTQKIRPWELWMPFKAPTQKSLRQQDGKPRKVEQRPKTTQASDASRIHTQVCLAIMFELLILADS